MTWVVVGAALVIAATLVWRAGTRRRRVIADVDSFRRARAAIAPDPWHRRRALKTTSERRLNRPVVLRPRATPVRPDSPDDDPS